MRKGGMACALLAGVLASGPAGANLLGNGDLESPAVNESDLIDAWVLVEPDLDAMGDPVNSATFISFANHTPGGSRGLWLRSFEGGLDADSPETVDAHLLQAVLGTPGVLYHLSAWFRYEAHYSGIELGAPTQTILAMDFLDVAGAGLSSVELDVDTMQVADGVWRQYAVNGVAPAGTTHVRARLSMLDGVFQMANPQSAFVDDFNLVPEPAAGLLLLPALSVLAGARRRRRSA